MERDPARYPDFTDGIRPRWNPRVPPQQIRRLYENDAGASWTRI
jgi:hypothetical protein